MVSIYAGICVIFAFFWLDVAKSHVALEFPRARQPPLDFLDNVLTPEPCGGAPRDGLRLKS